MNFAQTIYHGETHLLMQYVLAWPKNSYIGQRPGSCTSGPFPVWHIDDQHLVRGELTHRSSKGRVQRYGADETVVAYDRQTRAGMGDRGFVLTWPPHLGTPNDQCKTNAISQSFAYGPETSADRNRSYTAMVECVLPWQILVVYPHWSSHTST